MKKKLIIKGKEVELTVDETIEKFTNMIYKIARKKNREDILEELVQYGRIGVWYAYNGYDISRGFEFITLAHHSANQKMDNYIRSLQFKGRSVINYSLDSDNNHEKPENDCKTSNLIPCKEKFIENADYHMDYEIIKKYVTENQSKKMNDFLELKEKGYTERQMGEILGITFQAVNSRKKRLFKNIRKVFGKDFKEYMG